MKTLKAIAIAALSLMVCAGASAQTLVVKDFSLLKKDKTATAKATAKKDLNGKKYAVVKLAIDGQQANCETDAEVIAAQPDLAYVKAGEKSMIVSDPKTGAIVEYTFPVQIKSGKTYQMNLISEKAEEIVPEIPELPKEVVVPDQQFVLFLVEPANAVVEFNKETLVTKNGVAQKLNDVGTYEYTISAKGYYPTVGTVEIKAEEKAEVSVSLRPADGWLLVSDCGNEDLTNADIYVDGELQGKAPLKMGPFTGGMHKVLVAKDTYNNFTSEVLVIDNDTVKISPCLNPNFAVVTLRTEDKNADIWANGQKLGTGEWTGKLVAGVYSLESREIGYTSASIAAEIAPQAEVVTIEVPSPAPIYGKIIVTSYPAKAVVVLDGTPIGETPLYLPKVKYGEYVIEVFKCGYKPYRETVKMNESMRINVTAELEDGHACCGHCEEEAAVEEAPVCTEACCAEAPAEPACCEEAKAEEPKHECCGHCEEAAAEEAPKCCEEKAEGECCGKCEEKPAEEVAEAPACCEAEAAEAAAEEKCECCEAASAEEAPAETPAE